MIKFNTTGYIQTKDKYSKFDILRLGLLVFEDKNDFRFWLNCDRIWSFQGKKPIDLIKNNKGRKYIAQVLFQIEYGLCA